MEPLGWLLAYIVGFGLIQLLVYRYVSRSRPTAEAAPTPTDREAGGGAAVLRSTDGEPAAGVTCPHCGSFNQIAPTYAYCKECVEPLRS